MLSTGRCQFLDLSVSVKDDIQAHLLIEVDGNDLDTLFKDCEAITKVMEAFDCDDILFADSSSQKRSTVEIEKSRGEAVKSNSIYKEEDTVVPGAELPKLLSGVKKIGQTYGFTSVFVMDMPVMGIYTSTS